ncbi:hypothetical protein, partial [Escherichia coli]|uniref:hypothetical protein n=1 Tax=Escherichia coli TaxID=562 RepID=UPI001BFCC329
VQSIEVMIIVFDFRPGCHGKDGNDEAQREKPAIFPYFQSCDRMSLMMLITLTLQNGPYERI